MHVTCDDCEWLVRSNVAKQAMQEHLQAASSLTELDRLQLSAGSKPWCAASNWQLHSDSLFGNKPYQTHHSLSYMTTVYCRLGHALVPNIAVWKQNFPLCA